MPTIVKISSTNAQEAAASPAEVATPHSLTGMTPEEFVNDPSIRSAKGAEVATGEPRDICPRCMGTGIYNFGPCSICNATGKLSEIEGCGGSVDQTAREQEIRQFPKQDKRVETGPIQFEEDWPGIFIRGDNAFGHLMGLLEVAAGAPTAKMRIKHLARLLGECNLQRDLDARLQESIEAAFAHAASRESVEQTARPRHFIGGMHSSTAREWLLNGGGGFEDGEDGMRACTMSAEHAAELMDLYVSSRESLRVKELRAELEKVKGLGSNPRLKLLAEKMCAGCKEFGWPTNDQHGVLWHDPGDGTSLRCEAESVWLEHTVDSFGDENERLREALGNILDGFTKHGINGDWDAEVTEICEAALRNASSPEKV